MNNFKLFKIHIINLIIILFWIIFLWLNWITKFKLVIFFLILGVIVIYKIMINVLKNSSFNIQNHNILKYILVFNKIRNPVLLFLINLDILMYDMTIYYNNKLLNYIIFLLYLICINPVKIFYFKFYKVLWIWKDSKMLNIFLNRITGLILSILILTDVIIYIKNALNINILLVIYLYCLIISILCELIETRSNKWINILLVNNITTRSLIANRQEVNILSIILNKNNIDESMFYINTNIKHKIEAFQIGYIYYIIESLKYLNNKPNYRLYLQLEYYLDIYLTIRIGEYIYFRYNNWNVSLQVLKEPTDLLKLKEIYEYDYKVFKTLLFLYWDLEYYLEDLDYVKHTLIVDDDDPVFLYIKFNNNVKSEKVFLDKVKYKDLNKFWVGFESVLKSLLQFDLFNKSLNLEYKKDEKLQNYKLFDMLHSNVCTLRLMSMQIEPIYYENYIELWYQEWLLEINNDLIWKYQLKLKNLDLDFQQLLKILRI